MQHVHPTEARTGDLLQHVSGLSARADASGKAIKDGAAARLDAVNKRMEELRPQVLVSADAAMEYQSLVIERSRLNSVVMSG